MERVVAWSLVVLFAAPSLAGCAALSRQGEWDLEVTVGVLLGEGEGYPLTDVADAVDIAARQMASAGYGLEMKVLREDAGTAPAAAFDRLVQRGAAVVIAAVAPDDAQALAARAAAQKRPLLLATPAAVGLSGDVSHTLQVAQDARAVGRALAALAAREGVTRPVLVHADDPYVDVAIQAFDGAWNGTAPEHIVHDVGSQSDVLAEARRACDAHGGDADAIVVLSRADEAGWATRALAEAGCRDRLRVLAAPLARGPALLEEAGQDDAQRLRAAGVTGIAPLRQRMDGFRALFEAEANRVPGPYAIEAYDAAIYVVLASFASQGNAERDPVKATVGAADLQRHLLAVATAPGIQHQELSAAIEAAQAGDELDWPGFSHDDALNERRQPVSSTFAVWRVGANGGFENAGSISS